MHAVPGFWHPDDLRRELELGKVLYRLWIDASRNQDQKKAMFRRLQLAELRSQPRITYARSSWQRFDQHRERSLARRQERDTVMLKSDGTPKLDWQGKPALKPINVIVHERMARRAFIPFEKFDIAALTDYGNLWYDNNIRVDGAGRKLTTYRKPNRTPYHVKDATALRRELARRSRKKTK